MYFEEKLQKINDMLDKINELDNVLVWGVGKHTDELLKHTKLLKLKHIFFTDSFATGEYFGKTILKKQEIEWDKIDRIIVSSYKFQNEIVNEVQKYGKPYTVFYTKEDSQAFYLLRKKTDTRIEYTGNYNNWESACKDSIGYDADFIREKCFQATMKVINGETCFERDSVTFDYQMYTYQLLTLIGLVAAMQDTINILDFGGAMGSLFWQNKKILDKYRKEIKWIVVEQEKYVSLAKREIEGEQLSFNYSIKDVKDKIDITIFSGVLSWIPNAEEVIGDALQLKPRFVLIDRILVGQGEKICIQIADKSIYNCSYPVRVLDENMLINLFLADYKLLVDSPSFIGPQKYSIDDYTALNKAYIFERIN